MSRKYLYGESYTSSSPPSALSHYLWVGGVRIGVRGGLAKYNRGYSAAPTMPEPRSYFLALARSENCRYSDCSVLVRLYAPQRLVTLKWPTKITVRPVQRLSGLVR